MQGQTFSQRMGLAPMPEQMKLTELSWGLRTRIWASLHIYFTSCKGEEITGHVSLYESAAHLVTDFYRYHLSKPLDEVSLDPRDVYEDIKPIILEGTYIVVIEALESFTRHRQCPESLRAQIARDFEESGAAYRLNVRDGCFYPISTEEQAKALTRSLEIISTNRFSGAAEHLRSGAAFLTKRKFAESVRESIHAVESIACLVTNRPKSTLGDALKALTDAGVEIHSAFRGGLEKFYGYTSDERGVRHASLNEDSSVDEADALFMFGACASFCSYLIEKAKRVKHA